MRSTFNVLFYIKRNEPKKDGRVVIKVRITNNGIRNFTWLLMRLYLGFSIIRQALSCLASFVVLIALFILLAKIIFNI
jgi:hypothetical protein